jgi:hypothetical protein
VTVQVRRSDDTDCWQAVLPSTPLKNDPGFFKDKIP